MVLIKRKSSSFLLIVLLLLTNGLAIGQTGTNRIALLKYNGGGDWYANPTSLPNLIAFCNKELGMSLDAVPDVVDVGDVKLFNYPFVHITGHGNILFSSSDIINLRKYLIGGGFLHIDDNYGLRDFAVREMKRVFPELDFKELPSSHPIFRQRYLFPEGLPKIHEHDNKPPQAFGLWWEGRLVCLFTYESDLGDGWESPTVHNDSDATRQKALRMGANIIQWGLSN